MADKVSEFLAGFGVGAGSEPSDVDNFLAHFGVKGMRWGVRREDPSAGFTISGANRKINKELKAAPPGEIRTAARADGSSITVQKQPDGKWKETYLSKDAETFAKLALKKQHEMSNEELRTFIARANLTKQYDDLGIFKKPAEPSQGKQGNDKSSAKAEKKESSQAAANKKMKEKVDALKYEADYRKYKAQLKKPSRTSKVIKLISKSSPLFGVFAELDKMTGKAMSTQLNKEFNNLFDKRNTANGYKSTKDADDKPPKQKKAKKSDTIYDITQVDKNTRILTPSGGS